MKNEMSHNIPISALKNPAWYSTMPKNTAGEMNETIWHHCVLIKDMARLPTAVRYRESRQWK